MPVSLILERLFKWLFWISLMTAAISGFYKDRLPEPEFYAATELPEPVQSELDETTLPFMLDVNHQTYLIKPRYAYELNGVVVSYSNAGSFGNIWHHKRWKDFINLRDLCVIWGDNVFTGVYQQMKFKNDSWTCWASWQDSATGTLFKNAALSNNHLLSDQALIKKALLSAEPGDHIRLKGFLSEYENKGNGFKRGTSVSRFDTGNGACETIYLTDFEIVKKANTSLRKLFSFAKWLCIISLSGFLIAFIVAPFRINN